MREKIGLTDTIQDMVVKLSEGNPGAITVMASLLKSDPHGIGYLLDLDDMNMRGSQIWVGFKDYSGQEMDEFKKAVRARDPEMVAKVNEVCSYDGEIAVTGGSSFSK